MLTWLRCASEKIWSDRNLVYTKIYSPEALVQCSFFIKLNMVVHYLIYIAKGMHFVCRYSLRLVFIFMLNVDFADVEAIMKNSGMATLGVGASDAEEAADKQLWLL